MIVDLLCAIFLFLCPLAGCLFCLFMTDDWSIKLLCIFAVVACLVMGVFSVCDFCLSYNKCPNCKEWRNTNYCEDCGVKLNASIVCSGCGKDYDAECDALYCSDCGTSLKGGT